MLSFEFFFRFLLSRRAGSLVKTIARISVLGIWLGVAALIIVISVMNGFNKSIRSRLLEVEPHLVVSFDNISSAKKIKKHKTFQKLKEIEGAEVSIYSNQDVIVRTSDGFVQGAIASGVSRERLENLIAFADKKTGRTDPELKEKIKALAPGEAILGIGVADSMGLFRGDNLVLISPESLLGDIPKLSQATVKGFILTDVERIDSKTIYYILEESFPRLQSSPGRRMGVEVWLEDAEQADLVKANLQSDDIEIETWKERNANLFFALKMEKMVVSLLVGLSTLIAGLSIISVMVLLLTQKKKDVGNLLAMGMTRKDTKNIFVNVGMFLSMGGVVLGVITGIVGSFLIDRFSENMLPAFYEETNIPADVEFFQVATVIIIGLVFSFTALNITMSRLSSFNPSEILRS